jgi:hypothetical protein
VVKVGSARFRIAERSFRAGHRESEEFDLSATGKKESVLPRQPLRNRLRQANAKYMSRCSRTLELDYEQRYPEIFEELKDERARYALATILEHRNRLLSIYPLDVPATDYILSQFYFEAARLHCGPELRASQVADRILNLTHRVVEPWRTSRDMPQKRLAVFRSLRGFPRASRKARLIRSELRRLLGDAS